MNRKQAAALAAALALVLPIMTFSGCARRESTAASADPAVNTATAEPARPSENADGTARQDGERFDAVIMLEGMEEPVRYEHIRNELLGFEMDYDYESFARSSEPYRERFVSVYDDPEDPWNYLEVRCSPADAGSAAAALKESLSLTYDILVRSRELDRAGSCIYIEASVIKGTDNMADRLQMVYIIPAADGCRIAAAHCTAESAEGFGARFSAIVNTLSVIDSTGEKRLLEEQAVNTIRRYCLNNDPELAGIESAGEYPVYWTVEAENENEIVVLFRSYTGAQVRYHIDPVSGNTYVTEFVPGITPGEERTEETLNVWDYTD